MGEARSGLLLVLLSAFAFGASGPFGRALIDAGWSPGAAALVRVVGAAVVLGLLAVTLWRPRLGRVLRRPGPVLGYGVAAVAGVQVCFFSAVQTLPVGVALLLEYLAPVLVVAWLWLRTGRRPTPRTLAGGALALVGTVGVLDVLGGVRLDPVGVLWALAAAVCLACYFLMMGADGDDGGDPAVLACAGMVVGAVVVTLAALVGLLPVTFGAGTAQLAGRLVPAAVPVLVLVLGCTVLAYLAGAAGLSRLGAGVGSVVSLSEVLFAVLAAWLLLGQQPTGGQLAGGALVVTGVALARTGGAPAPAAAPPAAPPPAPALQERPRHSRVARRMQG